MKKKSTYGLGTKVCLILVFICGFFMFCNLFMVFDETEEIEGIVEHTYTTSSQNAVFKKTREGVPMCRVVWYDKDGEKVTYGMPDDLGYEVGDSYFLKVDKETNRIPKRSLAEGIVVGIFGLILCTGSVICWRAKFKYRTVNR